MKGGIEEIVDNCPVELTSSDEESDVEVENPMNKVKQQLVEGFPVEAKEELKQEESKVLTYEATFGEEQAFVEGSDLQELIAAVKDSFNIDGDFDLSVQVGDKKYKVKTQKQLEMTVKKVGNDDTHVLLVNLLK